jgi:predicted site-specific integrase-resolvase
MASDSKPAFLADYNTEEEHAEQLGVSYKTLRNWRRNGIGPPFTFIANRMYYYRPSTMKWLQAQERVPVRSTSSNAA